MHLLDAGQCLSRATGKISFNRAFAETPTIAEGMAMIPPHFALRRLAVFAACSAAILSMPAMPAVAKPVGVADVPSGKELFRQHCAQCHGDDATGNGAMAGSLNVKPADLTTLSQRANGTFEAPRIAEVIRYGGNISSHGTRAMPIWGLVFSQEGQGGKGGAAYSRRAVIALKNYLETIQKK